MEIHVRSLDPNAADEVALVAARMRETIGEVLGKARGGSLYDAAFLESRVREHLDRDDAAVLLGLLGTTIVSHVILRVEDEAGLFGTLYVAPDARRLGVAGALVGAGEAWMRERRLSRARTYTHPANAPLHALFGGRGYVLSPISPDFVKLERPLGAS